MTDDIALDPRTAQRLEADIASIAEALQGERRTVDRTVGSLLGSGWTGEAAEQYRTAWDEWCEGADTVLRALDAMSRLVGQARVELVGTDEGAGGGVSRLHARLGSS